MGIAGDLAYEIIDFCFQGTNKNVLFYGTKRYHAEEVFEAMNDGLEKYNARHLIKRYSTHLNRVVFMPTMIFENGSRVRGFVDLEPSRDHGLLCGQSADLIVAIDKENIHPQDINAMLAIKCTTPGTTWKEYSWT